MKVRCKFCNDVIMGDKKGKFIQCKCKSCYIDETEHYCRIGGNFEDIEAVIDFTEYNDLITENQQLKIQVSAREEVANKLENNWNELKKWLEENESLDDYCNETTFTSVLDKMEELEKEGDVK